MSVRDVFLVEVDDRDGPAELRKIDRRRRRVGRCVVDTDDHTIAVRRGYEQLARRAHDAPSLQLYADLADAVYLQLRGDHAAAIARFERLLPALEIKERVAWATARSVMAEALNGAGEHARAKRVLEELLAALTPDDAAVVGRHLETTVEEMDMAIHPHPTLSEAIGEAALGTLGRMLHI